jgi:hypothetical protein
LPAAAAMILPPLMILCCPEGLRCHESRRAEDPSARGWGLRDPGSIRSVGSRFTPKPARTENKLIDDHVAGADKQGRVAARRDWNCKWVTAKPVRTDFGECGGAQQPSAGGSSAPDAPANVTGTELSGWGSTRSMLLTPPMNSIPDSRPPARSTVVSMLPATSLICHPTASLNPLRLHGKLFASRAL